MTAKRLTIAAVLAGASVPLVVRAPDMRADATHALAILLGAIALNIAMGYAGQPSLGHGAFMGIGAFGYALLRTHADWGPVLSFFVAVAAACTAGWIVARGVARLRAPFVALSTWVVAWTFWVALGSFPSLTGGSSGAIVAQARVNLRALGLAFTLGPVLLYEIALGAVVASMVGLAVVLRRYGPALAAQREDAAAARAAGIDAGRLRTAALVFSAGLAAFAGILVAQVAGVADPTTFRPVLSIELFLAVLVGGAARMFGPLAGVVSILAVTSGAGVLARAFDSSAGRVEPLAAAALLGLVLAVGRGGIVALFDPRKRPEVPELPPAGETLMPHVNGARIEARGIRVSFGGLRALDGVSFAAVAGRVHAVIGPNGCGKTTLLRVLSGALAQDEGTVLLDGKPVDAMDPHERARAGIVRTLQRLALPPHMSVLDNVRSGMEHAGSAGFLQVLTRTPQARAEERALRGRAHVVLESLDLDELAARTSEQLGFGRRRLVQLARAIAAGPRVLLLDEPSAGLDQRGTHLLLDVLAKAREAGVTIVLVAHDLGLVRAVADRVTVLDAGVVIAEGTPDEVARDPEVRAAYMGD